MDKVRARVGAGAAADATERGPWRASDAALAAALLAVDGPADRRQPSCGRRTSIVRLGILDAAHEHFSAARRSSMPTDAAAWDGLARIWRDWGLPQLALGDASPRRVLRPGLAASCTTRSARCCRRSVDRAEARAQYEQALALDATAAYALNNLCYAGVLEGDADEARRRVPAGAARSTRTCEPRATTWRSRTRPAAIRRPRSTSSAASGDAARGRTTTSALLHLARRRLPRRRCRRSMRRCARRPPFAAAEAHGASGAPATARGGTAAMTTHVLTDDDT